MRDVVPSKGGLPIRLTSERWAHIVEEHNELAGMRLEVLETVSDPGLIVSGSAGELLALHEQAPGRWLVVVYRELENDGFVITAYLTSRIETMTRRRQIWPD